MDLRFKNDKIHKILTNIYHLFNILNSSENRVKLDNLTSGCRELMGSFKVTGVDDRSKVLKKHTVNYLVEITWPELKDGFLEFNITGKFQNQDCEDKIGLKFNCFYVDGKNKIFDHYELRLSD